jgi:hypothetical protein
LLTQVAIGTVGLYTLVTREVVRLGPATTHRDRLEVVEGAVSLLDDLDREVPLVVDIPAEFVAGLDVETAPERRRDRDHPPVVDRRFLGCFFGCHTR